jgi:LPXTG-motif cell wall-anchored protein
VSNHRIVRTLAVAALTVASLFGSHSASASTTLSFDFNTSTELTTNFNSHVSSGPVGWASSGGISDSGSISAPGSNSAVYATKSAFSIGPVGSTYIFTAYMKSVGNAGYSGMGFTAQVPSSGSASGNPYRPTDALGISVHGGGFIFSDGATNLSGNWNGSSTDAAITKTQTSTIANLLNAGSPDSWYKVVFTAVRDSATTFDSKVEVWPVDSAGTLLAVPPSAIFELNNRSATALINAPKIYSYFNLSGDRVYNFDNFSVNLSGGASVIDEGAPVVLTDAAVNCEAGLGMEGTVTDDGSSSIIERGFVYSTSADPNLNDTVTVVSGTTGSFSAQSSALTSGTYYVRAYATNSSGTSYGSEISVSVDSTVTTACEGESGGGGGGGEGGGEGAGGSAGSTNQLADTGIEPIGFALTGAALVTAGVIVLARRRNSRRAAARS